ncbi:transmembrane protein 135-like isoform X2 [Schistocerca nitens]|uniref:transmembrane protein 135-like isoform X2 n=1 Tax=Schistocerca nitens TaxID=7011 RepID=UPI0021186C18|nr:transmembrane protein 135-like isoform X2 [Schistocerca nitens]
MALFSKPVVIEQTCREYTHCYTSSCTTASVDFGCIILQGAFPLYSSLYLLALLMRGKIPSQKDLRGTLLRIIQSTSFLACHAFSYSLFLCLLRRILGNFNFLTASFIPAFLASYTSILVERPSRRGLLCLYVTNVASETLFRMAVWRGWVKPIPYGEVLIFMTSVSGLLYFYRSNHISHDSIYGLLRFIVGPFEESGYMENREDLPPQRAPAVSTSRKTTKPVPRSGVVYSIVSAFCRFYRAVVKWVKCHNRHATCPHPFSCFYYTIQGTAKLFSIGYGLQVCLRLLLQIRKLVRHPKMLPGVLVQRDAFRFGAFLGGFSGLFRMTSCVLRWLLDKDSKFHAIPSGLVAGLAFAFFPDNTIALYIMWKLVQIMYRNGVDKGWWPELPGATVLLYCLSTAILFHAAVVEPNNLRPSYWKFLHRVSGGWIADINRKPLDVYGLESSKALAKVLIDTKTGSTYSSPI